VTGWNKAPGRGIRDEAVKSAGLSLVSLVQRLGCGLARASSLGGDGASHLSESRGPTWHGWKLFPYV
jgi:hypothetical protein